MITIERILICWGVFGLANQGLTARLTRRVMHDISFPGTPAPDHPTGLRILEQYKPVDVHVFLTTRVAGAQCDPRRRRIWIHPQYGARQDPDTLWNVCHELWHPTQTTPFWQYVFQLKPLAEWVGAGEIVLSVGRMGTGAVWSPAIQTVYATATVCAGLAYFWGDLLPELDAVLHTTPLFEQYVLGGDNSLEIDQWSRSRTIQALIRYVSHTLFITVSMIVVLTVLGHGAI